MPLIPVRTSVDGRVVVVLPAGAVDMTLAPALRDALLTACDSHAACVVVDLAEVTFTDSTGLSVLIAAANRLSSEGRRLSVVNVQPGPWRLFSATGLVQHLGVVEAGQPLPQAVAAEVSRDA